MLCEALWCLVMLCKALDAVWSLVMLLEALNALWCCVRPCDSVWGPVMLCEALWCLVMLCEALWCRQKPFEALWCCVRACDTVGGPVMLCEGLWCSVMRCDASWYSVMPCDTTVTSWDVVCHDVFPCYALVLWQGSRPHTFPEVIDYATADKIIIRLLLVSVCCCAGWCVIDHKFHAVITLFLNRAWYIWRHWRLSV